jgi:hypothetical protein
MDLEAKFDRIEALLHATAERGNQMELRFNRRMDRADQRMDRADQRMDRAEERADRAEQRADKFDKKLEATHKLVQQGMRMLLQLGEQQKQTRAELRELAKAQKAWLDSMRGGNGNGHRRMN